MLPQNMPYYRGPCIKINPPNPAVNNNNHQNSLAYSILHSHSAGSTHVSNHPNQFGIFDNPLPPNPNHCLQYNNKFLAHALSVSQFNRAIYSFNFCHFVSSISTCNLQFNITLACNPFEYRRALLEDFTPCKCIFFGTNVFLDYIQGSKDQPTINGYMIHSY